MERNGFDRAEGEEEEVLHEDGLGGEEVGLSGIQSLSCVERGEGVVGEIVGACREGWWRRERKGWRRGRGFFDAGPG